MQYADLTIETATRPQVLGVALQPSGVIIEPCEETAELTTLRGFDGMKVEALQVKWLSHPFVPKIRQYREALSGAFDEYNMQRVLGFIEDARDLFIDWQPEKSMSEKIGKAFRPDVYSALDNAYYIMAERFFRTAGKIAENLIADELGRLFVLTHEEFLESMRRGTETKV